jgi:hypothetical protein
MTAVLSRRRAAPVPSATRRGSRVATASGLDAALAAASAAMATSAAGAFDRVDELRRNNAIHIIIVIAIIVLLAIAASLVTAAIILCAQRGGVLNFVVQLNPWQVKVDCVKLR